MLAANFFDISFSHHMEILHKTRTLEERLFYIREAVANRWGKETLRSKLKEDVYHHAGAMPSNFGTAITTAQLAMKALGMFRDEYLLDFINTEELDLTNPEDIDEPLIEHAIVTHIRQFIMTFGHDFTFISNQYRLDVAGHELFIDLLFFNRALRCFFAFELKTRRFRPGDIGQLDFYLEALDRDVKKPDENPSVGVILCANKDDAVVEYALSRSLSPTMVATYRIALPDKKLLAERLHRITEWLEEAATRASARPSPST